MIPPGCKLTKLGTLSDGAPVIAVTDGAGPNVIIGGHKYDIHYLSPTYITHESAVAAGKEIVASGKIPEDYANMKDEKQGTAASMNALLMAGYTSQMKRDKP